jgi:hypothetical protein
MCPQEIIQVRLRIVKIDIIICATMTHYHIRPAGLLRYVSNINLLIRDILVMIFNVFLFLHLVLLISKYGYLFGSTAKLHRPLPLSEWGPLGGWSFFMKLLFKFFKFSFALLFFLLTFFSCFLNVYFHVVAKIISKLEFFARWFLYHSFHIGLKIVQKVKALSKFNMFHESMCKTVTYLLDIKITQSRSYLFGIKTLTVVP